MKKLLWSATFTRAYKRAVRRRPDLRERIEETLRQLVIDPFHPRLHTHKLKGDLAGVWACAVSYDWWILFEFVRNPETGEEEILLLTMGSHDEVY